VGQGISYAQPFKYVNSFVMNQLLEKSVYLEVDILRDLKEYVYIQREVSHPSTNTLTFPIVVCSKNKVYPHK